MNLLKINDSQNFKRAKKSSLILFLLLLSTPILACDICGCFMGITPYDNQSSISLLYRYRSFSGYNGQNHHFFPTGAKFLPQRTNTNAPITNHAGNISDFEAYRSLDLRGRYFLSRRIELNAILPYVSNSEKYNGNLNTLSGIGDANIYAGYHLVRSLNKETINQRLILGGGLKLPTGKSDKENYAGTKFNTLSQTGTGSTDKFIYANYLASYKKAGLSLSTTYKINGSNKEQESIANSTTGFLNLFYNVAVNKTIKIVPSIQLAYEYSAGEKYKGEKTGEHVMNNLMSGIGADVFFKNITLNMAVQTKAWTAKDDHPQPAGRLVVGLTYNFNQLYYLFN